MNASICNLDLNTSEFFFKGMQFWHMTQHRWNLRPLNLKNDWNGKCYIMHIYHNLKKSTWWSLHLGSQKSRFWDKDFKDLGLGCLGSEVRRLQGGNRESEMEKAKRSCKQAPRSSLHLWATVASPWVPGRPRLKSISLENGGGCGIYHWLLIPIYFPETCLCRH